MSALFQPLPPHIQPRLVSTASCLCLDASSSTISNCCALLQAFLLLSSHLVISPLVQSPHAGKVILLKSRSVSSLPSGILRAWDHLENVHIRGLLNPNLDPLDPAVSPTPPSPLLLHPLSTRTSSASGEPHVLSCPRPWPGLPHCVDQSPLPLPNCMWIPPLILQRSP